MATAYQFACCGHSKFFNRISSKFHLWIASIKLLPKYKYGFPAMNDNQDDRQNGHRLSVCTCGHSTLVIYYPITSKFHIWINLSNSRQSLNMGFVR